MRQPTEATTFPSCLGLMQRRGEPHEVSPALSCFRQLSPSFQEVLTAPARFLGSWDLQHPAHVAHLPGPTVPATFLPVARRSTHDPALHRSHRLTGQPRTAAVRCRSASAWRRSTPDLSKVWTAACHHCLVSSFSLGLAFLWLASYSCWCISGLSKNKKSKTSNAVIKFRDRDATAIKSRQVWTRCLVTTRRVGISMMQPRYGAYAQERSIFT